MERVLVVDDHPMMRDGLRAVITVAFDGCELVEAASVEEALVVLERTDGFDLVMLDLSLPGVSGLSGLEIIRRQHPSTPVAIVSATVDPDIVEIALTSGAAGFIPKSLGRSAIVEALHSIAAGNVSFPGQCRAAEAAETKMISRNIDTLTPQQRVVLQLLVAGNLNKQIAHELDVSMATVKAHVSAILQKLGVANRTQAVILCNKVNFPPATITRRATLRS